MSNVSREKLREQIEMASTPDETSKSKIKGSNLQKVDLVSPEVTELLKDIKRTNVDPEFRDRYWRIKSIHLINNRKLKRSFNTYKSEIQDNSIRRMGIYQEHVVFSSETKRSVEEISKGGNKAGQNKRNVLGHAESGVHLVRHYDVLTRFMAVHENAFSCLVLVHKAIFGKSKPIVPRVNKDDNVVKPYIGFDCHVSARQVVPTMPIFDAYKCSHVFFYEHDDETSITVRCPRQILPYAVLELEKRHPVYLETPFLAVGSKVNHWEVKGETRRGFRFVLTKTGNKNKQKMESRKRRNDEIKSNLKGQLLEMRTRWPDSCTIPKLRKRNDPETESIKSSSMVNVQTKNSNIFMVNTNRKYKHRKAKSKRGVIKLDKCTNKQRKMTCFHMTIHNLPLYLKPYVSVQRLSPKVIAKYRTGSLHEGDRDQDESITFNMQTEMLCTERRDGSQDRENKTDTEICDGNDTQRNIEKSVSQTNENYKSKLKAITSFQQIMEGENRQILAAENSSISKGSSITDETVSETIGTSSIVACRQKATTGEQHDVNNKDVDNIPCNTSPTNDNGDEMCNRTLFISDESQTCQNNIPMKPRETNMCVPHDPQTKANQTKGILEEDTCETVQCTLLSDCSKTDSLSQDSNDSETARSSEHCQQNQTYQNTNDIDKSYKPCLDTRLVMESFNALSEDNLDKLIMDALLTNSADHQSDNDSGTLTDNQNKSNSSKVVEHNHPQKDSSGTTLSKDSSASDMQFEDIQCIDHVQQGAITKLPLHVSQEIGNMSADKTTTGEGETSFFKPFLRISDDRSSTTLDRVSATSISQSNRANGKNQMSDKTASLSQKRSISKRCNTGYETMPPSRKIDTHISEINGVRNSIDNSNGTSFFKTFLNIPESPVSDNTAYQSKDTCDAKFPPNISKNQVEKEAPVQKHTDNSSMFCNTMGKTISEISDGKESGKENYSAQRHGGSIASSVLRPDCSLSSTKTNSSSLIEVEVVLKDDHGNKSTNLPSNIEVKHKTKPNNDSQKAVNIQSRNSESDFKTHLRSTKEAQIKKHYKGDENTSIFRPFLVLEQNTKYCSGSHEHEPISNSQMNYQHKEQVNVDKAWPRLHSGMPDVHNLSAPCVENNREEDTSIFKHFLVIEQHANTAKRTQNSDTFTGCHFNLQHNGRGHDRPIVDRNSSRIQTGMQTVPSRSPPIADIAPNGLNTCPTVAAAKTDESLCLVKCGSQNQYPAAERPIQPITLSGVGATVESPENMVSLSSSQVLQTQQPNQCNQKATISPGEQARTIHWSDINTEQKRMAKQTMSQQKLDDDATLATDTSGATDIIYKNQTEFPVDLSTSKTAHCNEMNKFGTDDNPLQILKSKVAVDENTAKRVKQFLFDQIAVIQRRQQQKKLRLAKKSNEKAIAISQASLKGASCHSKVQPSKETKKSIQLNHGKHEKSDSSVTANFTNEPHCKVNDTTRTQQQLPERSKAINNTNKHPKQAPNILRTTQSKTLKVGIPAVKQSMNKNDNHDKDMDEVLPIVKPIHSSSSAINSVKKNIPNPNPKQLDNHSVVPNRVALSPTYKDSKSISQRNGRRKKEFPENKKGNAHQRTMLLETAVKDSPGVKKSKSNCQIETKIIRKDKKQREQQSHIPSIVDHKYSTRSVNEDVQPKSYDPFEFSSENSDQQQSKNPLSKSFIERQKCSVQSMKRNSKSHSVHSVKSISEQQSKRSSVVYCTESDPTSKSRDTVKRKSEKSIQKLDRSHQSASSVVDKNVSAPQVDKVSKSNCLDQVNVSPVKTVLKHSKGNPSLSSVVDRTVSAPQSSKGFESVSHFPSKATPEIRQQKQKSSQPPVAPIVVNKCSKIPTEMPDSSFQNFVKTTSVTPLENDNKGNGSSSSVVDCNGIVTFATKDSKLKSHDSHETKSEIPGQKQSKLSSSFQFLPSKVTSISTSFDKDSKICHDGQVKMAIEKCIDRTSAVQSVHKVPKSKCDDAVKITPEKTVQKQSKCHPSLSPTVDRTVSAPPTDKVSEPKGQPSKAHKVDKRYSNTPTNVTVTSETPNENGSIGDRSSSSIVGCKASVSLIKQEPEVMYPNSSETGQKEIIAPLSYACVPSEPGSTGTNLSVDKDSKTSQDGPVKMTVERSEANHFDSPPIKQLKGNAKDVASSLHEVNSDQQINKLTGQQRMEIHRNQLQSVSKPVTRMTKQECKSAIIQTLHELSEVLQVLNENKNIPKETASGNGIVANTMRIHDEPTPSVTQKECSPKAIMMGERNDPDLSTTNLSQTAPVAAENETQEAMTNEKHTSNVNDPPSSTNVNGDCEQQYAGTQYQNAVIYNKSLVKSEPKESLSSELPHGDHRTNDNGLKQMSEDSSSDTLQISSIGNVQIKKEPFETSSVSDKETPSEEHQNTQNCVKQTVTDTGINSKDTVSSSSYDHIEPNKTVTRTVRKVQNVRQKGSTSARKQATAVIDLPVLFDISEGPDLNDLEMFGLPNSSKYNAKRNSATIKQGSSCPVVEKTPIPEEGLHSSSAEGRLNHDDEVSVSQTWCQSKQDTRMVKISSERQMPNDKSKKRPLITICIKQPDVCLNRKMSNLPKHKNTDNGESMVDTEIATSDFTVSRKYTSLAKAFSENGERKTSNIQQVTENQCNIADSSEKYLYVEQITQEKRHEKVTESSEKRQMTSSESVTKSKVENCTESSEKIFSFSEIKKMKSIQFKKFKMGLTDKKFIDFEDERQKKKTCGESFQTHPKQNVPNHLTTKTHSMVPLNGAGDMEKDIIEHDDSGDDGNCDSDFSLDAVQSNTQTDAERTVSIQRSKGENNSSQQRRFDKNFHYRTPTNIKVAAERHKQTQSIIHTNEFAGVNHDDSKHFSFKKSGTGYFRWRNKYQSRSHKGMQNGFFVTKGGAVQTEEEFGQWKRFKERENIRKNIEIALREYRKTFEDTGYDNRGDEKVANYLKSLTDRLDFLQDKRDRHDPPGSAGETENIQECLSVNESMTRTSRTESCRGRSTSNDVSHRQRADNFRSMSRQERKRKLYTDIKHSQNGGKTNALSDGIGSVLSTTMESLIKETIANKFAHLTGTLKEEICKELLGAKNHNSVSPHGNAKDQTHTSEGPDWPQTGHRQRNPHKRQNDDFDQYSTRSISSESKSSMYSNISARSTSNERRDANLEEYRDRSPSSERSREPKRSRFLFERRESLSPNRESTFEGLQINRRSEKPKIRSPNTEHSTSVAHIHRGRSGSNESNDGQLEMPVCHTGPKDKRDYHGSPGEKHKNYRPGRQRFPLNRDSESGDRTYSDFALPYNERRLDDQTEYHRYNRHNSKCIHCTDTGEKYSDRGRRAVCLSDRPSSRLDKRNYSNHSAYSGGFARDCSCHNKRYRTEEMYSNNEYWENYTNHEITYDDEERYECHYSKRPKLDHYNNAIAAKRPIFSRGNFSSRRNTRYIAKSGKRYGHIYHKGDSRFENSQVKTERIESIYVSDDESERNSFTDTEYQPKNTTVTSSDNSVKTKIPLATKEKTNNQAETEKEKEKTPRVEIGEFSRTVSKSPKSATKKDITGPVMPIPTISSRFRGSFRGRYPSRKSHGDPLS